MIYFYQKNDAVVNYVRHTLFRNFLNTYRHPQTVIKIMRCFSFSLSLSLSLLLIFYLAEISIADDSVKRGLPADNRFGAYDVGNGKVPTTANWPQPPSTYSIDHFLEMAKRQRHIVMDTWKQEQAWMNPSMIVDPSNHSKIIFIWRTMPKGRNFDRMGYNWVDRKTWKIIKSSDLIEITNIHPPTSPLAISNSTIQQWRNNLIAEDARLFCLQSHLYLIYNIRVGHFKQLYYTKLYYDQGFDMAYVLNPSMRIVYQHELSARSEKNWTPFEYCPDSTKCTFVDGCLVQQDDDDQNKSMLLLIYSIQPHRIVMITPENNHTTTNHHTNHHHHPAGSQHDEHVVNAQTVFLTDIEYDDDWHWGEMRGGSRAIVLDDTHFITFFHSSGSMNAKKIYSYVMGAYLFQRKPPFAITYITKEPIMTNLFVNESLGWSYRTIDYIQFPMGVVMDTDHIFVSYGRNDRDGWVVQLNRTAFLTDLKPVRTNVIAVSEVDQKGNILPDTYKVVKQYD